MSVISVLKWVKSMFWIYSTQVLRKSEICFLVFNSSEIILLNEWNLFLKMSEICFLVLVSFSKWAKPAFWNQWNRWFQYIPHEICFFNEWNLFWIGQNLFLEISKLFVWNEWNRFFNSFKIYSRSIFSCSRTRFQKF